jgi:uncharacterized membrane protein YqgA involved in biofilm formation
MWGTLVNAAAIIVGGLTGSVFNKTLPQRYQTIIFQGIGLFIVILGISMSIKMEHILVSVFSLLLGGLVGELLRIDKQLNIFSDWMKRSLRITSEKFTDGFVSATLIYCSGAMAVLGAIEEGTGNFPVILLTKSAMDGFSAVALAAALGFGVIFSSISVAIYQGLITLIAFLFANALNMEIINELSAVGGILIVGLGINILEIKEIKVVNLLPSLVFVIVFMLIFVP